MRACVYGLRECAYTQARNGVCNEGRVRVSQRQESVLCDLGTDCTDCGVWHQTDTDRALVNKGAQAW